ncbi:transglycosylase family protein [Actinomadura keratinilytica]|uniref:G5 domain-containing protein n=1 Tax=Actinomadura keratinilytica TaxID=547461 RepID=A0ABP7Z2L8_9ACTN
MRRSPRTSAFCVLLTVPLALAAGCGGDGKPAPRNTAAVADAPRTSAPPARKVVIVVDGKKTTAMTTGTTVDQVLAEAKITLGPYDLVAPPRTARAGDTIKIRRLLSKPVTTTVKVPAPVVRKKSSSLPPFSEKVLRKGQDGLKVVQTAYVKRRGKKVKVVLAQKVKRKPVAQIIGIGPKPSGAGAASRLNWAALAKCESGGNPKAVNPAGYYGLYQFSLQTWASVGGTGKPSDASAAEQTYRAQLLYNKVNGRWQGQWPNCGSRLFS